MKQDQKDIQTTIAAKLRENPAFYGEITLRFEGGACRMLTIKETIKLDRTEQPAAADR